MPALSTTATGNTAELRYDVVETTHTLSLAGTSTITAGAAPAGAICLGVTIYVTTAVTGCTSMHVGTAGDPNRWGDSIALTAGTTTTMASFTAGTAFPLGAAAAEDVVFTAVGGGASFTAGVIHVVGHYFTIPALRA